MHITSSRHSNLVVFEKHFEQLPLRLLVEVVKLVDNRGDGLLAALCSSCFDLLGRLLPSQVLADQT